MLKQEKHKIKFSNLDKKLKISLTSNNNLNGLSESIDEFVSSEVNDSINKVVDKEKLKYIPSTGILFSFSFYDSSYGASLLNAGFTQTEIDSYDNKILTSFYIIEVYDTMVRENQTKLHTSYFSGIKFLPYNGGSASTNYSINSETEFTNFYLGNNFIENLTGSSIVYLKCSFFNAKTGKLQLFNNYDKDGNNTDEAEYFEADIDVLNKNYNIIIGGVPSITITAREILNTEYTNKINETVDSLNVEKPTYPDGKAFTSDGDYITL